MRAPFELPNDADVRLHVRPDGFVVTIARPPLPADPDALLAMRPMVNAWLTFDPGLTWFDRPSAVLAEEVLRSGGGVMLAFATLADAMACCGRLKGGVA